MASVEQPVSANLKPVSHKDGKELAIAVRGRRGIGEVIVTERSERLIQGVVVGPLQFWRPAACGVPRPPPA